MLLIAVLLLLNSLRSFIFLWSCSSFPSARHITFICRDSTLSLVGVRKKKHRQLFVKKRQPEPRQVKSLYFANTKKPRKTFLLLTRVSSSSSMSFVAPSRLTFHAFVMRRARKARGEEKMINYSTRSQLNVSKSQILLARLCQHLLELSQCE